MSSPIIPPGFRWNTPAIVSTAAVGIAAIIVALNVPPIVSALLEPAPGEGADDPIGAIVAEHDSASQAWRARFDGRSVFFMPKPPVREVVRRDPPPVRRDPEPVVDRTPPPPPSSYQGPRIVGLIGDTVILEGGKKVGLGEEVDGVRVLGVSGVDAIRLGHRGGEYDVSMWTLALPDFFDRRPFDDGGGDLLPNADPPTSGEENEFETAEAELDENAEALRVNIEIEEPPMEGIDSDETFADIRDLPPPRSDDEIAGFSEGEARTAIAEIDDALELNLDDHSRARLEHEREMIQQRLDD